MRKTSALRSNRLLASAFFVTIVALFSSSCAFPASKGERGRPAQSKRGPFKKVNKSAENRKKGYSLRNTRGVRINRKRPPRWETEGDALFFGSKSDDIHPDLQGDTPTEMMNSLVTLQQQQQQPQSQGRVGKDVATKKSGKPREEEVSSDEENKLPDFLSWGPLSTGPILSPKLKHLYKSPTPIQIESFGPISSKKNVVIAAPTGSGKTLAYLLPVLCRIPRHSFGAAIIVTPTTELALQIQAVVDSLWLPFKDEAESSVYVVKSDEAEQDELQWILTEMMIENQSSPIIAGTPAALSKWLEVCIKNKQGMNILDSLETVVLDEADRLLQTEALSRIEQNKRNGVVNPQSRRRLEQKSDAIQFLERISSQGQTFFAGTRGRKQLVCASATVGRTLRRQIMELTDAASVDMGSELVCADDRVGKDADKRKRSLLPSTIRHAFVVQEDAGECEGAALVKTAWEALRMLSPGPTIIFPGKTGVKVMEETLAKECALRCVKTLQDDMQEAAEELLADESIIYKEWRDTPIFVIAERFARGLDIPNVEYVCLTGGAPNSPAAYAHLAGRTGRAGKPGTAVTFVRNMKDAKRVINIGSKLGISFHPLFEDSRKDDDPTQTAGQLDGSSSVAQPSSLSKEALESLTVPVLKDMLKERGQKVSGRKGELVERLLGS